jgi:hypothetical protein
MRREWSPEDLIACWTLVESDWDLVANKAGATRLGFAVMLKFFELEARFPRHAGEVPKVAVDYIAEQVGVDAGLFSRYAWSGRTIEYHRAQVRAAMGFREPTVEDEDRLAAWLADEVCPVELSEDRLREAVVARCRAEHIEPPRSSRVERVLGNAKATSERQFTATIAGRVSESSAERLEQLAGEDSPDGVLGGGVSFLTELKADPGQLGLETMLKEIAKLERVRRIGLPPDAFADTSEKLLAAWRARAAHMYPSDFRSSPRPIRLTLLAALCAMRAGEITDGLVDLLIALVLKIDTRAERRVEGELINDLKRVRGPEDDLPADFELNRDVHYDALRQPPDATAFVAEMQRRHRAALSHLNDALANGTADGVRISNRHGEPWITVPAIEKQAEPPTLQALKDEVERRWGTIDLLDVLKEADYLTGFTEEFNSVASREIVDRRELRARLLLMNFGHLRDPERALVGGRDGLRFRLPEVRPLVLQLMTEWHQRYGGPGVMIYWHVERRSACIYSQLKTCSASEVAAMIEGLLRHLTSTEIDRNYTDTHGASIVGFA